MQLTNPPGDAEFPAIEAAVQSERIGRYLSAAGGDWSLAFKYYLWNCSVSESFYLSLHFCEIICRNAINRALQNRAGDYWYNDKLFLALLDQRYRDELAEAVAKETLQHGTRVTCHHVVSALTFGFWEHMATKRFDRYIWGKGARGVFPCAPNGKTYADVQSLIESVRRWRNRIAHHRAIFDKSPTRKHQDALELIKWVCGDTAAWVAASSKVPLAISLRPKP